MISNSNATRGQSALAVEARNIYFCFGRNGKTPVLKGVNIAVTRGSVYSLLGPSGCGKTTLLKCIIGQNKIQEGSLRIFGKTPGSKGLLIPGRGIGYMPQDLALYLEINAEETLRYFGSLYQMNEKEITERISYLVELLSIPDKKKQIKYLSGGEKRRVSFAVALIHKPPLLILDEPTVGVDPLLRKTIWNHLVDITKTGKMTIIITTHYIDEARQAHTVGLMRDGCLLAEKNPEKLIKECGGSTLEDVFLRLCQKKYDEDKDSETSFNGISVECLGKDHSAKKGEVWITKETNELYTNAVNSNHDVEICESSAMYNEKAHDQDCYSTLLSPPPIVTEDNYSCAYSEFVESWIRLKSLTKKNILSFSRNFFMMIIQMVIPVFETTVFYMSVGGDSHDLPISIVNMEQDPNGFSRHLLCSLSNRTILQKPVSNLSVALESVKKGDSWAAMYIHPDFTTCLIDRCLEGMDASNDTVRCSTVRLFMDMTNTQILSTIYYSLFRSFQSFASDLLTVYGKTPMLAEPVLKMEEPVYGSLTLPYTYYMAPGVILSFTFIMATILTHISIILERKQGLFDRTLITGATVTEVFLSFFFAMMLIMLVQITLVLICSFLVFQLPCNGPFIWVIIGMVLVGISGMSFGLLVSSICDDENAATLVAIATFLTFFLLGGTLWPVEAMSKILQFISYCLPITQISRSLRCILSRGWTITDHHIWDGYVITSIWIILFIFSALCIFKIRRRLQ